MFRTVDFKNEILFAGRRAPQMMVILSATDGKDPGYSADWIHCRFRRFNPETNEAYSAQMDGMLTIIRETSPTSFAKEQTVQTKDSAKQMVWDSETSRILLIAADFLPPTGRPRAGVAGNGGKMVANSFSIFVVTK